jgi:apolipoprotein N-acyltransferase
VAAASGIVLSLANPPGDIGPLAFVAMVPFLWVIRRSRPLRGLLLGFAFGFAYLASTLYWIRLFGWLAWGALSLTSAAFVGLFGLLAGLLWRDEHPVRSAFGLAALWTATEYLRSLWPLGGFTWGGMGYTQANDGFLMPLASVAGVWGVTFVVVLVDALVMLALERLRARRAAAAGLVSVALAAMFLPALIPIPAPDGQRVDVAIVQGNDVEHPPGDASLVDRIVARHHARLHRTLATDPPDLAVWPENALDQDPTRVLEFRRVVTSAIRAVGVPTLVGAIVDGPHGTAFNEDLLYDGRGRVVDRYVKVHLVPFGEYVPWRRYLDWISALQQVPNDLSPGHELNVLHLGELTFATVICFENSFPSLDRRIIAKGAGFLVVSTNNASYQRSAASRQHLIMSRFRAVENGRWVVHAAVSGISAFIDPHGGLHQTTGLFEGTVDRFVIRASDRRTLYNRFGDYVPWASLAAAGLLILAPRRRERRSAAPLAPNPRVLVVLPTYNERDTVGAVLQRLLAAVERADVLVVDDGSPDGTGEIVRSVAGRESRVRLLERPGKGGLAGAYLTGFRMALDEGYDLVVEMDADLSHQPEELPRLLQGAQRFDLTIGSRYVPGGSVTNWGLMRRMLSRGGNRYTRWVLDLPVADATSGFRVFRRGLLAFLVEQGIRSEGYGFQIELAYRAWRSGFAVGEVPITFRERELGRSKISRRIVAEALFLVAVWGFRDRLHVPVGGRGRPPAGSAGHPPRGDRPVNSPPVTPKPR